ncbi:excisionase family DNA binding protein [Rhodopirellula rubra]|uniref:Excisionase family DNA binding protein n=1 Tax=Aporhodopirellula rubra TaxID=980271 RepID=A0A7W5E2E2_9BACT|nr:excisionase family DNA binding protein [Aporhodopirellula rubra]
MHSPSQVADMLNVSLSLIYKLVNQGVLQCYRIGSAIRITDEQIQEFLAEKKSDAPKTKRRRNQRLRDIEL